MKTFLVVLNFKTHNSTTYAVRPDGGPGTGRISLSGALAWETVKRLAKNVGVKSLDDLARTPKILGNVRIYLAVK